MNKINIEGEDYCKCSEVENIDSEIKIVILQRGWNMIGKFQRNGSDCKLYNASVIRRWGTTNGLGEISKNGPTKETELDKCYGVVEFDYLTVVAIISCEVSKWKKEL